MIPFAVPFPYFSGQQIIVIRPEKKKVVDGLITVDGYQLLAIPGRIQPITDLRNLKSNFGNDVSAGVKISTPQNYPIYIETAEQENDYIFYRDKFWKVEQSLEYDNIMPHNEATATLLTRDTTIADLADLKSFAKSLAKRPNLQNSEDFIASANADYDLLGFGNGDILGIEKDNLLRI